MSDINSPFHWFNTGNTKTLRTDPQDNNFDIPDELHEFYDEHYSANLMKLTLIGPQTPEELA